MLKLPNLSKALVAGLLCAIAGASAYAAERISDFSLVDADGRFFQLSRHSNQDAVVLLAYDANSRDARRAISDLSEIAEQFADQAVAIAIMDVTGSTDKVAMREEATDEDIPFRILMDETQLVTAELGITLAAEVVVIDPEAREVIYRGALSSRYADGSRSERRAGSYLSEALTAIVSGTEPSGNQLASKGDEIDFSAKTAIENSVSYAGDIAPILEQRCVTCHQEGGIAPLVGLLIFAGAYLIMVFRVHWNEALPNLALVMPILMHTQFEFPFDTSLAHWIVFLTLIYIPDEKDNIQYRYGVHRAMILPAVVVPLMTYYYMGRTLKNIEILTRFENTGYNNYSLLQQIKDPGPLHLKYDNYILKATMEVGLKTKNEQSLQLFLDKAEQFVQHTPLLHVYKGMVRSLLVLGREKEAIAMVERARYLYPDTKEAWLQLENQE